MSLDAVEEMIETAYALKGRKIEPDVQEHKDLLSAFQSHGVNYLVVVGFAVIYHAQPRFTKDIDLFIKADAENARATYAALAAFGASLEGVSPQDSSDPGNFSLWAGVDAIRKAPDTRRPG